MTHNYWSIQFLPVDMDCKKVMKQFYTMIVDHRTRPIHLLKPHEVSNMLFTGKLHVNSDLIVYKSEYKTNKQDYYLYRETRAHVINGRKYLCFRYLNMTSQLVYEITVDNTLSCIDPKDITLLNSGWFDTNGCKTKPDQMYYGLYTSIQSLKCIIQNLI